MKKTKIFKSFPEYEAWTDSFENCSDYAYIPSAIVNDWSVSSDMFTECKSWKTALKRFLKAFENVDPEIPTWVECMMESCGNGYFGDHLSPAWEATPEEKKEFYRGGSYSWGVSETDEGLWYVFLNISGIYAGRKTKNDITV